MKERSSPSLVQRTCSGEAPKATMTGEERVEDTLWFLASSAPKLGSAHISLDSLLHGPNLTQKETGKS